MACVHNIKVWVGDTSERGPSLVESLSGWVGDMSGETHGYAFGPLGSLEMLRQLVKF